MNRTRVYRFRLYDISSDEVRISRRWATREAIAGIGGEVIESATAEIEISEIGAEISGMTRRDYSLSEGDGFQRQVRG